MHIEGTGRYVFWSQWVLAVFLPFWIFVGRGFLGAGLGWVGFLGLASGWILIVLLLVPPVLTLLDAPVRRARATRTWYDIATALLWLGLLVAGLSIPDSGDSGDLDTVFMLWFGASEAVSAVVFAIAASASLIAWIAAVAFAAGGIRESRRSP